MFSTRDVITILRDANPGIPITEDRIRHAIRRGDLPSPPEVGGRLVWTEADIEVLAHAFSLDFARAGR